MSEPGATPSVQAHVVGITDVGRVREHNEDCFLVMDRDVGKQLAPGQTHDGALRSALMMVVCDGMGGAAAGEVASRMASQRVAEVLSKADFTTVTPDQIATLMDEAVQKANQEIFEQARSNAEMKGMGTTLTAAVVTTGRIFVSQVGDSRAYLLRKGLLNQITKDQSLIGQLIEEGTLTEEEAEKLGGRNIVLQAVGVEETLRVDTKSWPLLRGDVILLCSDGLSGMVKDARMREILTESGADLHAAGDRLIAEANANGGRDNITAVLGRFDGEGLRAPMETESAGTLETAGATFKAPPPPEVPNPMKKVAMWGLCLLVAIAAVFIVFRPTKADVSLPVTPAGAKVRLLDKEGREVAAAVAGADPVKIPDVEPGDYRLEVTAPDHFDETQDLAIKDHGVVGLEAVSLVPMPGTLTIRTAAPDVTVTVTLAPDHPRAKDAEIRGERKRLPEPGEPWRFGNAAVGSWTVKAERPGFRTHEVRGHVDPREDEVVLVPPLEEIRGVLVVEGCAGGHVRVTTDAGDAVFDGAAATDPWEREVRAVKLRVEVGWPGYRKFEEVVAISEGARAVVKARREADLVPVTFEGTANLEVVVEVRGADGWVRLKEVLLQANGSSYKQNFGPGSYRVRTEDSSVSAEFEVAAGSGAMTVKVRKDPR